MILYTKIGAGVALAIALFFAGWKVESWRCQAAAEALRAAQAQAVAKALSAQKAASDAESARLNGVIAKYEQDVALTPVAPGIAHRVYVYAASHDCPLPKAGADTAGVEPAGAVPGAARSAQPAAVESALGAYIGACQRDALRLNALIDAWPR